MIRNGMDGNSVMKMLRQRYNTKDHIYALSSCIARVRSEILNETPIPSIVEETMNSFKEEAGVTSFLALNSLSEMLKVRKHHKNNPSWSERAEAALSSLCLEPTALASLKLSEEESATKKRKQEVSLLEKQDMLIRVDSAGNFLAYAIHLAWTSTPDMEFSRLALPILLLSGRRTTEIMNGKSIFTRTGRPTTCKFTGQLKKRGGDCTYEIPLLCNVFTFEHAMSTLRCKQNGEVLSAAATNNKYQKMLNSKTQSIFAIAHNVHQLRSIYAAFVHSLYACDTTFNRMCMRVLGHEDLSTSLSYNGCVLYGISPFVDGGFGPLPVG
jgi:hypothetical protein